MPVLLTKIEGRGNGIKTVVPNMEDVARALNRPPSYPTKFFGTELGAQTTMANDRYIVNGAHQADRLRELLDAFIDKFVLCASCKNPETELVITGRGNNEDIHRDCKACGAHTGIDMRHKLTTFILKNPPKKDKKKGKKGMTAEANVGGPMVFDEKDGSNEDDSPSGTPVPVVPTEGTDIDNMLGRGTDPIIDNPDALAAGVNNLHVEDDEEDEDSPFYQLRVWLSENPNPSDADVVAKIKELDIVGKHKALIEIGHKLFTDDVANEIPKRAQLLNAVSVLVFSTKRSQADISSSPLRSTRSRSSAASSASSRSRPTRTTCAPTAPPPRCSCSSTRRTCLRRTCCATGAPTSARSTCPRTRARRSARAPTHSSSGSTRRTRTRRATKQADPARSVGSRACL